MSSASGLKSCERCAARASYTRSLKQVAKRASPSVPLHVSSSLADPRAARLCYEGEARICMVSDSYYRGSLLQYALPLALMCAMGCWILGMLVDTVIGMVRAAYRRCSVFSLVLGLGWYSAFRFLADYQAANSSRARLGPRRGGTSFALGRPGRPQRSPSSPRRPRSSATRTGAAAGRSGSSRLEPSCVQKRSN